MKKSEKLFDQAISKKQLDAESKKLAAELEGKFSIDSGGEFSGRLRAEIQVINPLDSPKDLFASFQSPIMDQNEGIPAELLSNDESSLDSTTFGESLRARCFKEYQSKKPKHDQWSPDSLSGPSRTSKNELFEAIAREYTVPKSSGIPVQKCESMQRPNREELLAKCGVDTGSIPKFNYPGFTLEPKPGESREQSRQRVIQIQDAYTNWIRSNRKFDHDATHWVTYREGEVLGSKKSAVAHGQLARFAQQYYPDGVPPETIRYYNELRKRREMAKETGSPIDMVGFSESLDSVDYSRCSRIRCAAAKHEKTGLSGAGDDAAEWETLRAAAHSFNDAIFGAGRGSAGRGQQIARDSVASRTQLRRVVIDYEDDENIDFISKSSDEDPDYEPGEVRGRRTGSKTGRNAALASSSTSRQSRNKK